MTCPENLLIRHRQGTLSLEDGARLDAHIARCASCRLLLRAGLDMDEELETMPGDEIIAARIAKKLAPQIVDDRERRRVRPLLLVAAAVAVLAIAGLAAASLGALPFFAPAPVVPDRRAPEEPDAVPDAPPEPVVEEPTVEAPRVEAPVVEEPTVEATTVREPERPAPSAAELFAQGNARRREGDPRRAQSLYRELQRRHPRSSEAEISHVSLGRIELELGNPEGALSQFDRYLARSPRGALAEEALFGKASALGRLGRDAEERRTWQSLIDAFPESVYADRARARLGAR